MRISVAIAFNVNDKMETLINGVLMITTNESFSLISASHTVHLLPAQARLFLITPATPWTDDNEEYARKSGENLTVKTGPNQTKHLSS